jgi:hypothetical protein
MSNGRMPVSICISCGKPNDSFTAVSDRYSKRPKSGDISICLYCGHVAIYSDDLTLRELTSDEIREIAGHPLLLRAQKVSAKYREMKESEK